MTRLQLVTLIATLIAAITVSAVYINARKIIYTCTGAYSTNISLPGVRISGVVNIVISASQAQRIYTNLEGALTVNGEKYHLSREIAWRYEITNREAGLLRIIPLYETTSSTDTIKGTEVDSYVLGKEKYGRIIRQWQLNDNVALVGNPYSPIYSCVLVK
jgi:hypothetical protein